MRPPAAAPMVTTIHTRPSRTWGLSVSGTALSGSRSNAAARRSPFSCSSTTGRGLVSLAREPSISGGRNHPDADMSDSGFVKGSGSSRRSRGSEEIGVEIRPLFPRESSEPPETGGRTATTSPSRSGARTSAGWPFTHTREWVRMSAKRSP